MSEDSPAHVMRALRTFVKKHLTTLCEELIEWDETAILRSGRVREVAKLLSKISVHSNALSMVRSEVELQAMKYVVQHREKK